MLTVGVLGPVEVRRGNELLSLPSGRTTELLVRLALNAGSPVRTDVLLEDLWGETTGRNTLQSKVSQLRRALGDKDLVVASGDGYTLALDAAQVDALRVAELVEAMTADDPAAALAAASEGLALFRGEVLVDAGDWAAPHRTRLVEIRLGLLEDVMAARVALGAGGDVVGQLESLVEEHPLRERLWASLILALYRAGRQADALGAYARVRAVLVDELGVEPGPGLQSLHEQVLSQDRELAPSSARADETPGNLPAHEGALVGRAEDLSVLSGLVDRHNLVSLVGTAGVGKTRLAIAAARELAAPGGVWLVRLEGVDASADLVRVVAEALHAPAGEESLRDRLAGAATVLLLDNCEHVVEAAGDLVTGLLSSVPGLRILATSQLPLGVEGEQVHLLHPLSAQDSVRLFAVRAQEARRDFALDADTGRDVEEVCASLDGLPLAIELAAARVRSISVRDIGRRLDNRFAVLQDPSSRRPQRRRALAAAIGWSYDLLFPDDQRGLWALSSFAGSASLDAVEHVAAALGVPAEALIDTIARLIDRSLINADAQPDGSLRYRLLDSVGAYAEARLREASLLDVAMAAHAEWYAARAAWCEAQVRGSRQQECVAFVRAQRLDTDAALAWSAVHDPALGLRIAVGFGWTWVVLGDGTAGAARLRSALAVASDGPTEDRLNALLMAGWLEASAGDLALAESDLEAAGLLAAEVGDAVVIADLDRHRAFLAIQQGRPGDVLAFAGASLAAYESGTMAWHAAASLLLAAFGSLMVGDTVTASRHASEAARILEPIGDSWGLVHARAMLGGIAQSEHRFDAAIEALTWAADESRRLGFSGQAALHLASLARAEQRAGDIDRSLETYERAIAGALVGGDGRLAGTARWQLARALRQLQRGDDAVVLLRQNQLWYAYAGGGDGALVSRCLLLAETRDDSALQSLLDEARAAGNGEALIHTMDAVAAAAARQGDAGPARVLLGEADALMSSVSHVMDEGDRVDRMLALELLARARPPA